MPCRFAEADQSWPTTIGRERDGCIHFPAACAELGVHHHYDGLSDERRGKTSPATLFQRFLLYYHGVALVDRRSFGVLKSEGQHFLRLSYATDMDSIKEGVARIRKGACDHAGFEKFKEDKVALGV